MNPLPQKIIQNAQNEIGELRLTYRDTDNRFWTLSVAWETLRFAWYIIAEGAGGSARAKLSLLDKAIDDFKHWSAIADRRQSDNSSANSTGQG